MAEYDDPWKEALDTVLKANGYSYVDEYGIYRVQETDVIHQEEIDYAVRVVEAWERACADGRGVFTLDDKMIDAPLVALQQRVLERARRAGVLSS